MNYLLLIALTLTSFSWATTDEETCSYRRDLRRPATSDEKRECIEGLRAVRARREQAIEKISEIGAEVQGREDGKGK